MAVASAASAFCETVGAVGGAVALASSTAALGRRKPALMKLQTIPVSTDPAMGLSIAPNGRRVGSVPVTKSGVKTLTRRTATHTTATETSSVTQAARDVAPTRIPFIDVRSTAPVAIAPQIQSANAATGAWSCWVPVTIGGAKMLAKTTLSQMPASATAVHS